MLNQTAVVNQARPAIRAGAGLPRPWEINYTLLPGKLLLIDAEVYSVVWNDNGCWSLVSMYDGFLWNTPTSDLNLFRTDLQKSDATFFLGTVTISQQPA